MKTHKVTIRVSNGDIKNGVKNIPQICPIGLALKRKYPKYTCSASYGYAQIGWGLYKIPKEAFKWMKDFDNNKKVKSFKFVLDLPLYF